MHGRTIRSGTCGVLTAHVACRRGSLSLSGVDSLSAAGCVFINSSVPEWAHSPDSDGVCLSVLRLGYTAGDAVFAERFSIANFSGARFVPIAAQL
jgi:hypothetical protein